MSKVLLTIAMGVLLGGVLGVGVGRDQHRNEIVEAIIRDRPTSIPSPHLGLEPWSAKNVGPHLLSAKQIPDVYFAIHYSTMNVPPEDIHAVIARQVWTTCAQGAGPFPEEFLRTDGYLFGFTVNGRRWGLQLDKKSGRPRLKALGRR